eukprot:gene10673-biopygen6299
MPPARRSDPPPPPPPPPGRGVAVRAADRSISFETGTGPRREFCTLEETATPASGPRPVRVRFFEFDRAARVRSASGPRPLPFLPERRELRAVPRGVVRTGHAARRPRAPGAAARRAALRHGNGDPAAGE